MTRICFLTIAEDISATVPTAEELLEEFFGANLAIEAEKVEITGKNNLKEYIDKRHNKPNADGTMLLQALWDVSL
jgi:cyclopropane fatty-acyl-phospholipid synthase-like methyltransferase